MLFLYLVLYENDIVLFWFLRLVEFSDVVNSVCLFRFLEEVLNGMECYILGMC